MDLEVIAELLGGRQRRTIPDEGRARAAVLLALYGPGPNFCILYTVRTQLVEHHKGEISFPGGATDPEDTSEVHTALRESDEEMGINGMDIKILGLMDDVVTRSRFVVTPVVGRLTPHPYHFTTAPREVAEVLEVPLSHLRDPDNHTLHPELPPDRQPPFPSYRFGEHVIFGATAMKTAQFLSLLPQTRAP